MEELFSNREARVTKEALETVKYKMKANVTVIYQYPDPDKPKSTRGGRKGGGSSSSSWN